jgi:hypothetical protein
MRVVGIVALVSLLSAACALQPADSSDGTGSGSAPQQTPATATVSGGAQGSQSLTPSGGPTDIPPQCMRPPCDPQPQPWGGKPPVYVLGKP